MRLDFLYALENTLLDPDGLLMQAGIPVRMAQVQNMETREVLRQQIGHMDTEGLQQALDMRASYSAAMDAKHRAELPPSLKKSVLVSGRAQNPGEVTRLKKDDDALTFIFRPALAANNSVEKMRTVAFLALMLSGVEQSPAAASLTADSDGLVGNFDLDAGIALSNAGFLAGANGGVPLPLNELTGTSADQSFTLTIDAAANAGVDFSKTFDVQMLVEYEAQI